MCIPLLNHITAVVPNPSCTHLRSLELELKQFIVSNNPSMVDDKTRIMSVRNGGSGVPNIKTFWKAIRMSWLRKSICLESSWFKLHRHDVYPNVFDPQKSNFESLTNAKSKCVNPFWKEVYSSMIECRLNVLLNYPAECRHIPINGEPLKTCNNIPVRQEWAQSKCLDSIIDHKGNLKGIN